MENPSLSTTIGNVCFIRDRKNGKVLLLRRNREPMRGLYTGVGGKTLADEGSFESCVREAKEETGLDISGVKLRGVVKTILDGSDSSWILSVYVADGFTGEMTACEEGDLEWVNTDKLDSYALIGFIKILMPLILDESVIFDGVIVHDANGNVVKESIETYPGS